MANLVPKAFFLLLFLSIVLLLISSGQSDGEHHMLQDHGVKKSTIPPEWKIVQGPCSKFPECNQYCLSMGFPLGGSCGRTAPQSVLYCLCKSH
ncbi:defensin-like protein 37 [Tripterygium wilfordii]|uniref:defensin-like protein 37 n=1 Tax=Tripterygium wilfordii TaxID=458696 RepID=UPI0018F8428A|nr:defensin-like protein 37 [Tripterygium wilfordii]